MKCYYCSHPIRQVTIICPVCNRQQHQTPCERLSEYLKELFLKRNFRNRTVAIYR
jgi:hypothetical protein